MSIPPPPGPPGSRPPLGCADRSGFLFAHDCDRPVAGQCARCGKPICVEHTRMSEDGPTCIACLRQRDDDDDRRDDRRDSDTNRSSASSDSSRASEDSTAFVPAGGAFGGAGAGDEWAAREDAPSQRADDPYFYGTAEDRASYYDADDFRAFDVAAAAAGAGTESETGDDVETDTGAS
jgi:hypothetical protein